MQFELTTCTHDAAKLAAALHPLDPDAQVTVDEESGYLEVISTATTGQVQGVLEQIGCAATPLAEEVHISGGSTCCGGCS